MIAVIASNTWSVAGNDERDDVNHFYSQLVVNYNLDKGWYLVSAPTITADWNQESDNRWMVPLGGGVGRIVKIGSVPNDIRVQAFGYAAKPEFGPSWTLRFEWKVMFIK